MRRKLQTSLTIVSLTLCVSSTLFLILFSDRTGLGILSAAEEKLTIGFSTIFSRFLLFISILFLALGAIFASFLIFAMMSQRTRDIGLMKAAGCPNNLIFGYFFTELLVMAFISCLLGVILGLLADFALARILNNLGFQIQQNPANIWKIPLIFVSFFILMLVFGAKPILSSTKVEPAKALSPTYYWGIATPASPFKASKQSLTVKIALRGIFRRASATIRIVLCLTLLFLLLTVTIAGGVIAKQTTESWIERAVGRNILLIAHHEICNQYHTLLSKFHESREIPTLNYIREEYLIPEALEAHLNSLSYIGLERRLIVWTQIREVQGTVVGEHGAYITVGDSREGESLVVGVEPENTFGEWFLDGGFLKNGESMCAVVGDSIANSMFTAPLEQYLQIYGYQLDVVGVCVDPINNGKVVYVNMRDLQMITGVLKPNILLVKVVSLSDYEKVLNEIRGAVKAVNRDFEVLELNKVLEKSLAFLGLIWSTILFLPFSALASAVPCLIGYVVLALTEQRQEFGVLRALGAKPKTIVKVVAIQNIVVLLSSYACGIAFGIMITLLILVPNPLVTSFTVLQIAGLLSTALAATFLISLYPAVKLNRKSILEMLT